MTKVSLLDLSKTHPGGGLAAVDSLSLEVESGTILALLGPSGCGKTTALKMIAGLITPSSGDIRFDGESVLQEAPEQRGAVMVFQDPLLFPHMSVAENVGFGLKMRGLAPTKTALRVAEMLEMVQLPDLGRRRPDQLSGGQRQRVALARALILRPKALLLDEPLSGLDAGLRAEMLGLIAALQKATGVTTIFVTHDQEEAVALADQVALMFAGRLRQIGPPEEFFRRPADQSVARFFGGVNFVPGAAEGALFHSPLGPLHLPEGTLQGSGVLTIRPESIRLGAGAENTLTARIVQIAYLGSQMRLRLAVGGVPLEASLPPDLVAGMQVGGDINITLPRSAIWVLD